MSSTFLLFSILYVESRRAYSIQNHIRDINIVVPMTNFLRFCMCIQSATICHAMQVHLLLSVCMRIKSHNVMLYMLTAS